MTRARVAAWLTVPLILLATAGCRDNAGRGNSTGPGGSGGSVEQQLDQMESTLDSIESEVDEE